MPELVSHNARRAAAQAARDRVDVNRGTGMPWDPWAKVIDQAERNLRKQIAAALKDLEHDMHHAEHILNTANGVAKEASGRLVDAAWDTWHRYMKEAERAEKDIMKPAYEAYHATAEQAKDDYTKAVDAATFGYRQELAAAEEARSRAAGLERAERKEHPA